MFFEHFSVSVLAMIPACSVSGLGPFDLGWDYGLSADMEVQLGCAF
jgi:hypothetical protein